MPHVKMKQHKKIQNFIAQTRKKSSVLVATNIVALIFLSKFMYIPYMGSNDIEGHYFGYGWLSSFLWSLGNELTLVLAGSLIIYSTNFIEQQVKRTFKNIGLLMVMTGMFFLSWVFYQDGNFTKLTEISFAILTSISSVVLALKASKVFGGYIEYLKGKIRMLVDVLLEADKHIKDIQVWDIEVINPTLDKLNE